MEAAGSPVHEPRVEDDEVVDESPSDSGSETSDDDEEPSDGSNEESDNNNNDQSSASEQSKFQVVLSGLSESADESVQLCLLTQLCEVLSFCGDAPLPSNVIESLSPILVRLSGNETNPDIMLVSIRAVTYLCDQSRRASRSLVAHNVVPALCQRLIAIEYLDVAEQCLQALGKISREQPLACLQSGVITAALCYIDFFSTSVQRVALSAVAYTCRKITPESSSLFMDSVPILCNLLQYEDRQLVESVAACLITIVEQVRGSPEVLDEICNHGLVHHALHLISMNRENTLRQSTYIGLIGLLVRLVHGSTIAYRKLFELDVSKICKEMLASHGALSAVVVDGILKWLNELLPTVGQQESDKERFLSTHPDILQSFGVDLLPTLIQMVDSGVNSSICYGCLSVINKLVHFTKPDDLITLLRTANLSSFLAGVFTRKDRHVTLLALRIVDSVMSKLPNVYLSSFIKEGVVFAVHGLLSPDTKPASPNANRCQCFSFESTGVEACSIQENTIPDLANRVWTTYFEAESGNPEKGVTDILQKFRTLSTVLTAVVDQSVLDDSLRYQEDIYDLLQQIVSELNEKDSISAFEFVESGIIRSLSSCLSKVNLEKRLEFFGRLLLSDSAREESPLLMMVKRLQTALSSFENFPVISNHKYKPIETYSNVPNEGYVSHPCLRVQFSRDSREECLSDYVEGVVYVDPFVPLDKIEEYLRERVSSEKTEESTSGSEDSKEKDSVSSSSENEDTSRELLLCLEGKELDLELTLYQSITKQNTKTEHDVTLSSSFWSRSYKITYRRNTSANLSNDETTLDKRTPFFQFSPVVSEGDIENPDVLSLLKITERINRLGFHLMSEERTSRFAEGKIKNLDELNAAINEIPVNEFVNKKITEKLEQQMRDPMCFSVGSMPAWCVQLMDRCPFLFGFETRCGYFRLAALGQSNSQAPSTSDNQRNSPRKKTLVHRDRILESATQMMDLHAAADEDAHIEVEYAEEVGTGLGPTLEFYTLVCREFQMSGLGMWRDDIIRSEKSRILSSSFGLFPRPWSAASSSTAYSEVIQKFSLLGFIVAKALEDGRVLDLPLSKAFYKLILGEELTLYDIQSFDPDLGRALLEFRAIVEKRDYLRSENLLHCDVLLRNTRIEDLCLDFTLPGYPDYAISSDSKMVTLDNLDEYVTLVVDATTASGVYGQVEAFMSGFAQVFPIEHLKVFTEEELERLLCGEHVPWNSDELLEHIKFDHGYTVSSPPIVNLLEIMQEFDLKQQRAFLQFVTGAPRLPTGGLASLNPKLTIVRKHCSDVDLPSVMTCANYLKLPPYSSKEVMKGKLLYAITDGQGSFHLS